MELNMTISLRTCFATALALGMLAQPLQPALAASAFDLVTAAEAQQEARAVASAPPEIRPRSVPGPKGLVPSINVLSPAAGATPGAPVPAPLRIELAFKPAPGARIVPSTFRVLYGLLKIDLTERLRKHATVSESGVVVEGAQVPDGQHRLILQVADDQGNTAERELLFRVGGAS
jgi:hypothetical protein